MLTRIALASLVAANLAACSSSGAPTPSCDDADQCDDGSFAGKLNGRRDPVAKWLLDLHGKGIIDDAGVLDLEKLAETTEAGQSKSLYGHLVRGAGAQLGCDPNAFNTYVISDDLVTGSAPHPRLISTACSGDDAKAAQFFAATLGEDFTEDGDVELENLEMFAWDPGRRAKHYRFYATSHVAEGKVAVEVSPERCRNCHLTPRDVDPLCKYSDGPLANQACQGMPVLPILNELTNSWTHWDVGAGGNPQSLGVPAALEGAPEFTHFAREHLTPVPRFEQIVRGAVESLVVPARVSMLNRAYDLEQAMSLIRPVFCDEQLNYATESSTGGVIPGVLVAGGLRDMYNRAGTGWDGDWQWLHSPPAEPILALTPTSEQNRIFMMPVRGHAEIAFESELVTGSTPALSTTQILQVKAMDWQAPVLSEFRCGLWKDALARFKDSPPEMPAEVTRNVNAISVLFDEIFQIDGNSLSVDGERMVSMARADGATVAKLGRAAKNGTLETSDCVSDGFCVVDLEAFGTQLHQYVRRFQAGSDRSQQLIDELEAERNRRLCAVFGEVEPVGGHVRINPDLGIRVPNAPSLMQTFPTTTECTTDAECIDALGDEDGSTPMCTLAGDKKVCARIVDSLARVTCGG